MEQINSKITVGKNIFAVEMSTQKRIAIVEIGGSHDECILSQLIGLKQAGAWVALCCDKKMYEKNSAFKNTIDCFHEVSFPHTMLGDFFTMKQLNKWFKEQNITTVIANTAQGGHIRNLCLTAPSKINFFGIIHTIKMLNGSFTQTLISTKIKTYFVLNDTLKSRVKPQKGRTVHSFYPLSYAHFGKKLEKKTDEIWIGIIGGVESRRKDLTGFLKMAQQTPSNVQFIFLGKSDAKKEEVAAFKQAIEQSNLTSRVQLFDDFVSEVDFDAYLSHFDGLMPLVHPNTPSAEEYFSRQISGAINNAFAYKIPLMIHENYRDWEDFNTGVEFYNLNNFGKQFSIFLQHHTQLKQQLIDNPKFSATTQNQQFAAIVMNGK